MKSPRLRQLAVALSLSLLGGGATARAEPVALPGAIMIDLPEGWQIDGPVEGELSKSGIRRVHFSCESERCQKTQETCTLLIQDQPMEGSDDLAKVRLLYQSPLARYARLRAVLRSTSRDAEILKPLELVRIGDREWHRVETDARHNYKSGLFAETVLSGLYVGAICKTCETGEARHQGGLAILQSLRPRVDH